MEWWKKEQNRNDKELERSEAAEEIQHEVSEEVEERGLREEETSDIALEAPAPCVSGAHGMVFIVPFKKKKLNIYIKKKLAKLDLI